MNKKPSLERDSEQSGDTVAADSRLRIERLFNEHNEALVRFLRVRLRSDEEAKEVAQEAYVRLLQLDQPEAVSYFRAFLFRTASNLAIDRLRKETLDRKRFALNFFAESEASAEDIESQRELLRRVGECLEELPPKCRKAFLLSRFYGLSTHEIADQMRMTKRMIRIYLARATEHCKFRLEPDHERSEHN